MSIEFAERHESIRFCQEYYNTSVMTGWPDKQITPEITLYFSKRHEITVEDSCLLWGIRVIITHWAPRYCPYEVTRATSRLVA